MVNPYDLNNAGFGKYKNPTPYDLNGCRIRSKKKNNERKSKSNNS